MPCQTSAVSPCLKRKWGACCRVWWSVRQWIRNLLRDVLLSLSAVSPYFISTLPLTFIWTMHPADLKVPLSFLHGWRTPPPERRNGLDVCVCGWRPAPLPIRTATATLFLFYSGNWLQALQLFTLLNNVGLQLYLRLSWPVILIWRLSNATVDGGGGRISIDGLRLCCWMFNLNNAAI